MKKLKTIFSVFVAIAVALFSIPVHAFGVEPAPVTFHATTAPVSDALVTSMGAHKPEIYAELVRPFRNQGTPLYDIMAMLGYRTDMDAIAQTAFSHFEEGYYADYASVLNTVADAGAGNPITIAIDPSSVFGGSIYARIGDLIKNPNTGAKGRVINRTGSSPNFSIVVQPWETATFGGVTAGDQLFIQSNAFLPGTDQPLGRVNQVGQYNFSVQIFKETVSFDNSEDTNQLWFTTPDGSNRYTMYAASQGEYRLKQYMDGQFIDGNLPSDATTLAAGYYGSTSLTEYIGNYGITKPYIGGTLSLNDLKSTAKIQFRQWGADQNFVFGGVNIMDEIGTNLGGVFAQNPVILAKRGDEYANMATHDVDLQFQSVTFPGTNITYHMHTLRQLSHQKLWGLPGYFYEGWAWVLPNNQNIDAQTKVSIPNIRIVHKQMAGYSRKLRTWWTGGGGRMANNTTFDNQQMNIVSECGLELFAGNQMAFFQQTS